MKNWIHVDKRYDQLLMDFDQYKVRSTHSLIPTGAKELFRQAEHVFGYYILDGELMIDNDIYGKETFLLFTDGHSYETIITKHLEVIYVETQMPLKAGSGKPQILVEPDLPYNRPYVEKSCCSKYFMTVKEHGAKVQVSTYTKGATTPTHTHSMAHGFFLVEGMLNYWVENEYQLMGPGDFIVVPANIENEHHPANGFDYVKYFFIADDEFDFLVDGKPFKPF